MFDTNNLQAYEALHTMYEASEALKAAALLEVAKLKEQRLWIWFYVLWFYDFMIKKGKQLPATLSAVDNWIILFYMMSIVLDAFGYYCNWKWIR